MDIIEQRCVYFGMADILFRVEKTKQNSIFSVGNMTAFRVSGGQKKIKDFFSKIFVLFT